MKIKINDLRQQSEGMPIKRMPLGTFFVCNMSLFLKAANEVCVDMQTGKREPFNEDYHGQPVEVTVTIVRNMDLGSMKNIA